MKIWFKVLDENHILESHTIEDDSDDTRTHKIFNSLDEACHKINVGRPIWLDANIRDFKKFSKTRFSADNFVESIEFEYLEIEVLEED